MVPGSHRTGQQPHEMTRDEDSMLRRGQRVIGGVDESGVTDIVLAAGEASLHHPLTIHSSGDNLSDQWRLAVTLNYVSSRVLPDPGYAESALLVRGSYSPHGPFHLEQAPSGTLSTQALANYEKAVADSARRYSVKSAKQAQTNDTNRDLR